MEQMSIIKTVDRCGRVTLPKTIRESLSIEIGEDVAITVTDDCIQIKKVVTNNKCIFCGIDTESQFKGLYVCTECVDEMYATV